MGSEYTLPWLEGPAGLEEKQKLVSESSPRAWPVTPIREESMWQHLLETVWLKLKRDLVLRSCGLCFSFRIHSFLLIGC